MSNPLTPCPLVFGRYSSFCVTNRIGDWHHFYMDCCCALWNSLNCLHCVLVVSTSPNADSFECSCHLIWMRNNDPWSSCMSPVVHTCVWRCADGAFNIWTWDEVGLGLSEFTKIKLWNISCKNEVISWHCIKVLVVLETRIPQRKLLDHLFETT